MAELSKSGKGLASILAVIAVISLSLLSAGVLDFASNRKLISLIGLFLLGIVIAINVARFLLWGWIHKRIDLSKSYPMTAFFFPLVALMSAFKGDPISAVQWVGVGVITLGFAWFSLFVPDEQK